MLILFSNFERIELSKSIKYCLEQLYNVKLYEKQILKGVLFNCSALLWW